MHANVNFHWTVKLFCFQNTPVVVVAWYSMATGSKGNKVNFKMFKKWGKDNIIGYKTIEEGGRKFVNFVWCKVCTGNKDSIFMHLNCKGSIKTAIKAYTDKTNYVTKHVTWHLKGEGHRIALSFEKSKPENERVVVWATTCKWIWGKSMIDFLLISSKIVSVYVKFLIVCFLSVASSKPIFKHRFKN